MNNQLHQDLEAAIDRCMIKDRFRLRKALHRRQARHEVAGRIEQSVALAESRRALVPAIAFPPELPVSGKVPDIEAAIAKHQVVIIAGETGSGKTTQIPKICLAMGLGVRGLIGHTQPRRVAARTVSHRIAEELKVGHGEQVGYQVRFTDATSAKTLIKVMTDGILLAETQNDRFLEAYDTIIIDEAHERSLNIDFLLGYLKRILPKRPDLKVIVTSATIDVVRFSRHFDNAPVIEVSGRTYPVAVHYRPPLAESRNDDPDELLYRGVIDVLGEIVRLEQKQSGPGDVLVFLSGEREIRDLAHEIRKSRIQGYEVLPLYSRLSVAEQNRVFEPHKGRRIVLATNVAETSLTVPGVRYVIDPGFARISRYSLRSKVQQLPIEPISKASAEQRKGRCGRVSDGVCFRLYSEEDYEGRPDFTPPEIMRTNLASVILQMLTLHLGDMARFPFVEKPDQRQINDGFSLLAELQAVDDRRQVTRLGKDIARFPVDLKLARVLLESARNGCLSEVLTIVSVMAIQDPRERPIEYQQAADEKHRQHFHEQSDFLSLLNLWQFYETRRQSLTGRELRRFCRDNFLSYPRMREWKDNHRQLRLLCREMGLRENQTTADYASIHRSLLSGLLGNIGERADENEYLGTRNRRHYIFPGSSQFKRKPRWIMSAELVETTRLFGRTVAAIDNEWIEPLARHLVKRNYHEPHFDPERGQVFAFEEVMLYGLTIIKRRKTDFGAINPVRARQIFIRSGLVEQQLQSSANFYRHNRKLIAEVEELESRARKRDILVDSDRLYRFYDDRIPAEICSEIELVNWCRQTERARPKLLYLSKAELMNQETVLSPMSYPDTMEVGGARLKLEYQFDPEHDDDGVSLRVPVAILRQVDEARLDWLIPGLLREKCLALLKSLPKSIRKNFVPAPDYADRILGRLVYDGRPLHQVMASALFRETGVKVPEEAFDLSSLDRHLRMNIKVVDEAGKVLGASRDLSALVTEHQGAAAQAFSRRPVHAIEVDAATDWVFGDLPDQVEFRQSGINVPGFPAIIDQGETVAVRILDNEVEANRLGEAGVLRLIMLNLNEQRKYIEKNFPEFPRFAIYFASRRRKDAGKEEFLSDLVHAVFRYTFIEDRPAVKSKAAFEARLAEKQHLMTNANRVGDLMVSILERNHRIEQALDEMRTETTKYACHDIRQQLDRLLGEHFVVRTPVAWLSQFPRYLAAIEYRLGRLQGNLARDRENTTEVNLFEERYFALDVFALEKKDQDVAMQYRFMLEEFRVSLFAQPLGTSGPVSAKRLEKLWQDSL